ncbi:hypothetical protein [Tenacibaculum discolor]|uniref:hypothetical protein n=1 Tax=Tenacibaculum discolor TaxID=361581 RepID=UPI000F1585D9|nr:hypothetical protein [Tenacibaculum discolor]RLK00426.1 hypothetical protein C8N27_2113 [Tenacibaculum discolor]
MKRKLLLSAAFLLISFLSYSQQYNYQVKITDFNYWYKAKSGLCGDAKHITLSITFEDNTTNTLYKTSNIKKIDKADFIDRFFVKKPKSIHVSSFIHEEDKVGLCNGYTAKVTEDTGSLSYIGGVASGSLSGYDNGGNQAIIDVKFNYEVSKVEKNYNYKIEYDIDLYNESLNTHMEYDNYSGTYSLYLKGDKESKRVYRGRVMEFIPDPLTNTKYDSIVRFMEPLTKLNGKMNISFRTSSQLRCEGQVNEFGDFYSIDTEQNTTINDVNGCLSQKYLFPWCGTTKINYFNFYRIYKKLGDIELNKPNFGEKGISPELKDCEPFRVYVNDCNEESSYAVEYSIGGNFKTYLPYARRESYFDLDYSKLEGVEIGGGVSLRIKYYNSGDYSSNPYLYSDLVNFTIFGCSPKLTQEPTPIKTTCSYTEDGSFTFTVGRNLIESENEKMIATLYYEFTSNNYDVAENGQEEITSLIDNKNGTYSYTWKGGLPPGNYKLKYQTYNGTGGISPDDSSWDDLRFSEIFEIKAPLNIIFEAERFSDENCVKSGDGKIRVFNVSGGTGEGYEYELNESTDWIPFDPSNIKANEVIIGGRGKGTYKVKVRDSKKCVAKE